MNLSYTKKQENVTHNQEKKVDRSRPTDDSDVGNDCQGL